MMTMKPHNHVENEYSTNFRMMGELPKNNHMNETNTFQMSVENTHLQRAVE